jgi:regulator of protease activity HflC (stomatin/prohibitin superfamily)
MFWFFVFIIVGLAALVLLIGAPYLASDERGAAPAGRYRVIGAALLVFAFFLLVISGIKSVPTKSIGVPVSFGSVHGASLSPGLHETWTPWENVQVLDETIQTTTFTHLKVRIGGQQTAELNTTIQWRIKPAAADTLYTDYANQGDIMKVIENAVVTREFEQVVNATLGDYNPIQDVSLNSTAGNSQFSTFGPLVLNTMRQDIGSRIEVISVLMPYAEYDATTQARLNTIQQQFAATAIAKQEVITNTQQSLAFAKLGVPSTAALVSKCLDLVKTDPNLPVGFSCFPGSTSSLALNGK